MDEILKHETTLNKISFNHRVWAINCKLGRAMNPPSCTDGFPSRLNPILVLPGHTFRGDLLPA